MTTYTYNGPPSGVTLADGSEVLFYPGQKYGLPEDNEYVQALVSQRRLVPEPSQPKTSKSKGEKA
ncbi:hypothetical protein COW20_15260 [bacterium (Candidatus Blackallbacteria) CG13_big_fil_rev_8_21_14_2_50_49_14]|nr:MAG: hypothetical protein COW64_15100 [bacterium (Candidatus Blackallbacteria) CG18_big_fil_WC_8_21_14_2_50_49_26]PIW46645.1 MAG: hypothetical protein COW20_15260 [bacterium (Candidatus Blackallbacteria) CG13_big_fil_rev_8_21_14_2_50_49_14]